MVLVLLNLITVLSCLISDASSASSSSSEESFVTIYSWCDPLGEIHQNNGLYYIKPSQSGPVIPVICSNGYTLIDPSLDVNLTSFPYYLSSYDYARESTDAIYPSLDDVSTFREWWLPSDTNTNFRIAPDCGECIGGLSDDDTVYYTDGNLFCYTAYLGNGCLEQMNEYACNKCDVGRFEESDDAYSATYWSRCSALQMPSDAPSWHDPDMRVNHHMLYRPVMSLLRDACTCYQPSSIDNTNTPITYIVNINELPLVSDVNRNLALTVDYVDGLIQIDASKLKNKDSDDDSVADACTNVIYLTQNDFLSGTYRIRECGEYVLTENIECNFNAPTLEEESDINFSPNTITGDRLYWYPTPEQIEYGDYPGLYNYTGSYSLGFFAGITIEAANVIINLNGFSFTMDRKFYLQQRFFSLIELGTKPFLPIQGASTWGVTDVFYASNVHIKGPGNLGLTSHHAIHGNYANNINITNLNIMNFEVAGIACNGCTNMMMVDLVIGPQNNDIPTLGRFTHSRAFIPRLKDLNDNYGDEAIQFYGRDQTTVGQLCSRMVNQMDMIYNNYINGQEYDDINDEEWLAAKKIYYNPTGWMDGGTSYGIAINGGGAAVVAIGQRHEGVTNINITNVEIYGIYNQVLEKMKFSLSSGTMRGILFDVTDWIGIVDQIEDRYSTQYIGDVYSDIQFAVQRFITSWYYRNSLFIGPEEEDFVFNGNLESNNYPFVEILPILDDKLPTLGGCSTDIQLHSSKGAVGIMVSGAQQSIFNNIYIHDVYNWADLGTTVCGPYTSPHLTDEDEDIQYGYTGTRSNGMILDYTEGIYSNLHIENIESYYGLAVGITVYKESYINIENIYINNINAGSQLTDDTLDDLVVLPNHIPRACAIDVHDDVEINYITGEVTDNIIFNDIYGFDICDQFAFDTDYINAENVLNGSFNAEFDMPLIISIVLFTIAIFGILGYFSWVLIRNNCIKSNLIRENDEILANNKNVKNNTTIISESTPLLTSLI